MAYPTTDQLKTWLSVSGATDDAVLGQINDAAKDFAEQYCGRVFVAASATRHYRVHRRYVSKNLRTLSLFADLAALTSVTNGDGLALNTSTEIDLHPMDAPYHQIIIRKSSGKVFTDGGSDTRIAVVGTWGYAAACPAAVFEAILEIGGVLYRARGSGGQITNVARSGTFLQGVALPEHVVTVLDKFRRYGV